MPAETHSESKLDFVFLVANGLLLALVAAGSFVPHLRLWGVDHLSYFPPFVRLGALFVAALTLLPGAGEWLYNRWISAFEFINATSARRGIFAGAAVLSALGLFIAFQASTELLGDGQLQSKLLVRMAGSGDVTFGYFARTVLDDSMAPATNLLVYAAAKLSGASDPLSAWRFLNGLLGCLFVLAAIGIVYRSRARVEFLVLLPAALFVSGGIQLFFGYIETYAPMVVLVTLYIATAFEHLHGRKHVLIPCALFVLAVLFHYQALLLGPSFIFILLTRIGVRGRRTLSAAICGATVTAAVVASRIPGWGGFFLPLFSGESTSGVLDPAHIADIANEVLLIVPIAPLLVALAVAGRIAGRTSDADPERHCPGASDEPAGARDLAFAVTIHVPCFLFLIAFLPELGMARDWDLFASPAFGAALPLLVLARRAVDHAEVRACLSRFLAPAVVTGLAIVIPWVGINANETRSVDRYRSILDLESIDAGYGYEILAMHFEDRGDFAGKAITYDKAYAVSGNPRHLVSACSARLRSGEIERATSTLKSYLDANPEYDLAREVYIEALVRTDNMPEVIRVCVAGIELNSENPYYHYYLGVAYRGEGFPERAAKAFADCRRLDPPTIMLDAIDDMTDP